MRRKKRKSVFVHGTPVGSVVGWNGCPGEIDSLTIEGWRGNEKNWIGWDEVPPSTPTQAALRREWKKDLWSVSIDPLHRVLEPILVSTVNAVQPAPTPCASPACRANLFALSRSGTNSSGTDLSHR